MLGSNRTYLYILIRGSFISLTIFLLSSCRETGPSAGQVGQRDVLLGFIAFFLFLATLGYAGFKAFVEPNASYARGGKSVERRSRATGFTIGILLTAIVIAADSDESLFSTSSMLAFFPWYIFTCLGGLFGFAIAVASGALSRYSAIDGLGFVILVLAALSSTGLYLAVVADGLRDNVLAAIASILIGLLFYKMLLPFTVGQSDPSSLSE